MAQIRVTPSGILDKDGDVSYTNNGNYVDANDIRHRQIDGGNFGGVMGTQGNINLITTVNGSAGTTLPPVSATSTGYRIYFDLNPIVDNAVISVEGDLTLEDSSGAVFSNLSLNISTTTVATFVSTLKGFFNALAAAAYGGGSTFTYTDIGGYVSTGTYTGYFTLSTLLDTDYVLRVNNYDQTAPLCNIVLVSEYNATASTFKVIGSYQLEDFLFVWLASESVSTGVTSQVSEIGVVYTLNQGKSYEYKTLVKSKKLGFSKERRIDAEVERVGSQINFYWTDGNEKPRAMYLNYSLVTTQNGFMSWEGGRYELETIDVETSFFFRVSNAYLTNLQVVNTGGTLTSGNKRYTGRFLTEDLVTTEFIYPTNPVNIYEADTDIPSLVHGDDVGVITNKSVTMRLENFPANVYKYFELAVVEYVDEAYTASIVQRYTVPDFATSLNVFHTQNGQDNIPLGANELVAIYNRYISAENIRVHDNRVVFSNLKQQIDLDLSSWALGITHSLESKSIPAVGSVVESLHDFTTSLNSQPSQQMETLKNGLNEYLDPLNVLNNTSYMYNDTYRFGIQVKWKVTGKWSAPYYVDDIRFDSLSYNINVGDTRRLSSNIVTNITDSTDQNVFIHFVKFSNINLNTAIGGVPLRDLIEGFRFVRAERIPEVLATGYFFLGNVLSPNVVEPFQIDTGTWRGDKYFDTTDVNFTTDIITYSSAHGYFENEPLYYTDQGNPTIGGLVNGFYYYVSIVTPTQFRLRVVPNGPTVDLTSSGSGIGYRLDGGSIRENTQ
jgi:hypothetical protein